MLTLLACLLIQVTAVQTHVHSTGQARLAASAAGASTLRSGGREDAADCPLCQQAAMAGAYLLPSAIALPPPPALPAWAATANHHAFDLRLRAHDWRSRAPPQ